MSKSRLISFGRIAENRKARYNYEIKENLKEKVQCSVKVFRAKELYLAYNDEINFKWKIIDKFLLKHD